MSVVPHLMALPLLTRAGTKDKSAGDRRWIQKTLRRWPLPRLRAGNPGLRIGGSLEEVRAADGRGDAAGAVGPPSTERVSRFPSPLVDLPTPHPKAASLTGAADRRCPAEG